MIQETLDQAIFEWSSLLGERNVMNQDVCKKKSYGITTFPSKYTILGALLCKKAEYIPEIVKIANTYKIPLYPVSWGKNWWYGNALPPEDAVVLDLGALKKISGFDETLGVITIEPGVTQEDLSEFLAKQKVQYITPVHGGGPNCSILGNALERGYGLTPHIDHFGAVMSLKAVLPNGEIYQGALYNDKWPSFTDRLHKWGVWPYLDGLFSQSNLGIVISITISLRELPEKIELLYFRVKKEEDLEIIIPKIQKIIKQSCWIVWGINLMNTHRILSMTMPYPEKNIKTGKPLSETEFNELARLGGIEKQSNSQRSTVWSWVGSIYGSNDMVKAVRFLIRKELKWKVLGPFFLSRSKLYFFSKFTKFLPQILRQKLSATLLMLSRAIEILYWKPNEVALALGYWKSGVKKPVDVSLDPSRDSCGLYWYSPLIPFKYQDARAYLNMVTRVCKKHDIEPLVTFTTISERCFDSTLPILFDKQSSVQSKNAEECYNELYIEWQKLGYLPYRYGISSMHFLENTDSSALHLASMIKKTIDPNNIIAPGRYVFTEHDEN